MKLSRWLKSVRLTHSAFGEKMRPTRRRETVLRWCNGHTTPDMSDIIQIEELTEGDVTARDWAEQHRERNIDSANPAPAETR